MLHRLFLLGLLTAGLVRAEDFRETFSQVHPLSPQGKVQIENQNGSISIRTWDRAQASIQVEKSASNKDTLKAIGVEIQSDPDSLSIKVILPKHEFVWHDLFDWSWATADRGQVQLTVIVPSSAVIGKIAAVNGGITLTGTKGPVDASTVNGTIYATGLHQGVFSTVNGSIHAAVERLDSNAHLVASTVNGPIEIVLPKDTGSRIHVSTVNGPISCDFPITVEKGVVGNNLNGAIGTGGGSIELSTVNGEVHVQSL